MQNPLVEGGQGTQVVEEPAAQADGVEREALKRGQQAFGRRPGGGLARGTRVQATQRRPLGAQGAPGDKLHQGEDA